LEDIRYSEDVKDAISLANRLARKARRNPASDRDYLLGLLLTHRKFNRLDSLLSELKIPVSHLKSELNQSLNETPVHPTSDLLKNAELLAQSNLNGANGKHTATVEVEHLLKAFCMSADPVVSRIMDAHQLSPDRINASILAVRGRQTQRSILFFGKELAEVVIFVLFFLILIKSFLGELRLIPSESMVPGLQINDRLVIERVTRITRPYQRGDILVFYPPMTQLKNDPWSLFLRLTGFSGLMYKKEDNIDVAYIKRLIGLPGDLVNVKPGVGVFVNGKLLNEPYINEVANTCTFVRPEEFCGPVKVPPGSYYMMGDNRNMSLDSRYWGFARQDRVIGRAVYRIWPPDRIGTLPPAPSQE
jgi:signal peptidase I